MRIERMTQTAKCIITLAAAFGLLSTAALAEQGKGKSGNSEMGRSIADDAKMQGNAMKSSGDDMASEASDELMDQKGKAEKTAATADKKAHKKAAKAEKKAEKKASKAQKKTSGMADDAQDGAATQADAASKKAGETGMGASKMLDEAVAPE
jgi:hypothetical protein